MKENIPLTYIINWSVQLYSIGYQYIAIIDNFLNAKEEKSFPKKIIFFSFFRNKVCRIFAHEIKIETQTDNGFLLNYLLLIFPYYA